MSSVASAGTIMMVEFKTVPTTTQIQSIAQLSGVESFTKLSPYSKSDFFNRVYELHSDSFDYNQNTDLKARISKLGLTKRISEASRLKSEFDAFSLVQSTNKTPPSNDQYINYQWGLANNGQYATNDIDDTHPEVLTSKPGFDIGWANYIKKYESQLKRDVRVAVIDSGLDINHPEIRDHLFVNSVECMPNPLDPKYPQPNPGAIKDNDGNGFPGDCIGWNFSDVRKPLGTPIVNDDFGHGTFNAGIIGADINMSAPNSHSGVSGITNHVKIIPIKAYNNSSPVAARDPHTCAIIPSNELPYAKFVHNIAKSILYAVMMNAEVINLSLGWPQSTNTPEVQAALDIAFQNKIVVVAAAGNNGNDSPVFPCFNKNVICVGGTNMNGTMSYGSNFGGFVDTVAPGNNIMGIIPTLMDTKSFVPDYDVKSGTSQAAPHITALVAILKNYFPNITLDEIRARIFASGGVSNSPKYVLSGQPKLDAVIEAKPQVVIRPVFKTQDSIIYNLQPNNTGNFSFTLPIKNYWVPSNNISINVTTNNSNVTLDKNSFLLTHLGPSQEASITISGKILNLYSSRDIILGVELVMQGKSLGVFKNHYYLTRSLENDPKVLQIPISQTQANLQNLKTVPTYFTGDLQSEYYTADFTNTPVSYGINLSLFSNTGGAYVESAKAFIENATSLAFLIKSDFNYNGQPSYLVGYAAVTCKGSKFFYAYLDSNLKPLKGLAPLKLDNPNISILTFNQVSSLRFVRSTISGYGDLALPVYLDAGTLTDFDQSHNPSLFTPVSKKRIYFYEPVLSSPPVFRVRAYNNLNLANLLQSKLHVTLSDSLNPVDFVPQSKSDYSNGLVSMILAFTRDGGLKSALLSFKYQDMTGQFDKHAKFDMTLRNGITQELGISIPGLESRSLLPAISLDNSMPNWISNFTLSTLYSFTLGDMAVVQNQSGVPQLQTIITTSPADPKNTFVQNGILRTYIQSNRFYSFFTTLNTLILKINDSAGEQQFEKDIIRSSFLNQLSATENLAAVVRGSSGLKTPAIYVNATTISSQHVFIWTPYNGDLIAPALMNVNIPSNCKALNPTPFGSDGQMDYSLLCDDGQNFSIRHMPIE